VAFEEVTKMKTIPKEYKPKLDFVQTEKGIQLNQGPFSEKTS
jgi:hypothetical protein